MLQFNQKYLDYEKSNAEGLLLQLLLFVDKRSGSEERVKEIRAYLQSLQSDCFFKLDVVEIEKQPHLVEFLKLVATPALVKISPAPRQTLAGSNIIEKLERLWPQWKAAQENLATKKDAPEPSVVESLSAKTIAQEEYYSEKIELSEEIFSLKQQKAELIAQLRFKDTIMAMVAHDLRTPLTAASMAVETIELSEQNHKLDTAKLESLKQKLFRQAKDQFGIMNCMIGELLQNSQSMNAKLQVKAAALDLRFLSQEVIAQFDARLKQKGMILNQDIPQDLPLVYADEKLIRQLISNLLDNAIKYTPEQGQISLSILHRTNQKVQVSICDTGPGIPLEKRKRIFEDSFRLQRDRTSEGYGLGLATCRQIIRAHYGQIWVESYPEQGSCFQFTLLVYK
ncbi:histidine kinase [Pleurocapsales cyanobacterium LEGE 10410]|nr:histidine kinase [Pleurocapsales cyanobacterium LEGE 10410]